MTIEEFLEAAQGHLDNFIHDVTTAYQQHVGQIRDDLSTVQKVQESPEAQLMEGFLPPEVRSVLNGFAAELGKVISDLPGTSTVPASTSASAAFALPQRSGAASRQVAARPVDDANPGAPV